MTEREYQELSKRLAKAQPLIDELKGCREELSDVTASSDEELALVMTPSNRDVEWRSVSVLFITADADELFQLRKCVVEIYDRRIKRIEDKLKDL